MDDLVAKWRAEADALDTQDSSKWFSSMTQEEQIDYRRRHTLSYQLRVCARELEAVASDRRERA